MHHSSYHLTYRRVILQSIVSVIKWVVIPLYSDSSPNYYPVMILVIILDVILSSGPSILLLDIFLDIIPAIIWKLIRILLGHHWNLTYMS
jgi:hypothetical protein